MDDLTLLDVKQAAARLHATVHFVRTLIADDELKVVAIGKKFCITQGDLDHWVQTNRQLRSQIDEEIGESLGRASARRLKSVR